MKEKINWTLVIVLTVVGAGAIALGLALEDFQSGAWSGLLIEIGAGVGLIGAIGLTERQLIRRIGTAATTAAAEVVRTETADLQERIIRLENLEQAQQLRRTERRKAANAAVDRVLAEPSAETVGQLLLDAESELLVDENFGVRASGSPDSPVLYMYVIDADAKGQELEAPALWLDFETLRFSSDPTSYLNLGDVYAPRDTDSLVMWTNDKDAAELGDELEANLERTNRPTNGFDFTYALTQLTQAVEIMRVARVAPAGSPFRLGGKLRLLLNDHWVITEVGLEAVHSSAAFPIKRVAGGWVARHLRLPSDFDESSAGWNEAAAWLTDQGILILRGDEKPPNPFAGMTRDDQGDARAAEGEDL